MTDWLRRAKEKFTPETRERPTAKTDETRGSRGFGSFGSRGTGPFCENGEGDGKGFVSFGSTQGEGYRSPIEPPYKKGSRASPSP